MILGILARNQAGDELKQKLREVTPPAAALWSDRHLAFCSLLSGMDTLDELQQPFLSRDKKVVAVFEGKIYNLTEIQHLLGGDYRLRTRCSGEALVHLYDQYGEDFLERVNGKFAFALWDGRTQRLILGRDRLGIQPLFYANDGSQLIFSSSLTALAATGWVDRQLNQQAVLDYLLYCYNPGDETFLRHIYKLPPGHLLSVSGTGASLERYWHLSFAATQIKTEAQYCEEIPALIEEAIRLRLDPHRPPGILLSGGIDSSTLVSLTSRMKKEPLSTFSFRCEGRSYDESSYARFVAQHYGTHHTEIPYQPEDLLEAIAPAVESMDEPFCDIGIEIGTFLLGRAAAGKVAYVFSGEGGDELFAGHPVYSADKVAVFADRLPKALVNPALAILQSLPDSDGKKNLQVKLKRFAYSLSFPPELLSHRWRVYYKPQELSQLCSPDFLAAGDHQNGFESLLKYNQEADGKDRLSRSLYSDYCTLVNFYLRRLSLLRPFALENRLPLLDHRLVEYAAQIPSPMKMRGFSNTKYIYKKALVGTLPDEILFKRPKLGHSVPMKNWLRDSANVQAWLLEVLCDRTLTSRGFFNPDFVRRLVDEHWRKTHNHSHRLWGLGVLELWLRNHLDG
jgi:asparagine synthase (glutamine-hydrolysing)